MAVTLLILIFIAALLYSSVGQAGASGYLAAMALCGVSAAVMKPAALVLNLLVAAIATVKFCRAGCFSWPLFWPLAASSVPSAFLGGSITLPGSLYKPLVGVILLIAAYFLLRDADADGARRSDDKPVPLAPALASGAGIGLLSGLTGMGGGVLLTPLLLLMGWAEVRRSAGVSAAFILLNSAAGLAGHLSGLEALPAAIPSWSCAAALGGWIGAEYGSRRLGGPAMRRVLAVVLIVAALKLVASIGEVPIRGALGPTVGESESDHFARRRTA